MKKIILAILLGLGLMTSAFAETIHIKHAYAMEKSSDGKIFKIRVLLKDGYHDWYVCPSEYSWKFYGFQSDDVIIVDVLTDIAVVR